MKFQLFLTEACNLNCGYCFEGRKKDSVLKYETLPAILNFMKTYTEHDFILDKTLHVNFNGGEALLEIDLLKNTTKFMKNNGVSSFSISTNFTLINDEIVDFLVQNNFTIQISIDGQKETHDLLRKDTCGNGTFDTVFKNIKRMKSSYPFFNSILQYGFYTSYCFASV